MNQLLTMSDRSTDRAGAELVDDAHPDTHATDLFCEMVAKDAVSSGTTLDG
jgi:hypothetical protein